MYVVRALVRVGEVDARAGDPDQDLAVAGLGRRESTSSSTSGPPNSRLLDRAHGAPGPRRLRRPLRSGAAASPPPPLLPLHQKGGACVAASPPVVLGGGVPRDPVPGSAPSSSSRTPPPPTPPHIPPPPPPPPTYERSPSSDPSRSTPSTRRSAQRERMLGGAADPLRLAASFFDEVRAVGPVGDDFADED